ncbi:MAG: tRNA (guanosine(46)-N7)-methyltransferase TrmB [Proteobacteria bacterium]|nr:tRNA (guanosine(46)-N7)-methyltransferase TrmB [Pseudomonadota bacterium]
MHLQDDTDDTPCLDDAIHQAGVASDREIRISQWESPFDWKAIFGNTNPVEIEIGCGRGMFIIKSALENPEVNYLGIEKSLSFFRMLKEQVKKSTAENIRLIRGEAFYLFKKFVPQHSVRTLHIYFPDPWPKKRHHKRRLVNAAFFEAAVNALMPQGCIFIATDFQDYFAGILQAARACQGLEELSCQEISPQNSNPETARTSYERKYLIQGRTICKASYRKK